MTANCESYKGGHSVTGGLKMGVSMAAHTRHVFLGSAPPGGKGHSVILNTVQQHVFTSMVNLS